MNETTSPFPWLTVGHWTDTDARTGCTVLRFDTEVVASGEVRGGAPGTREFAMLDPRRMVPGINAVVLTGGSAFGLAACDGVVRGLEAQNSGYETQHGVVPIVVGMCLYDLGVGDASVRPGLDAGRHALDSAAMTFQTGAVGAGTGATTNKWRGPQQREDGGLVVAVARREDVCVTAIVAVNAVGGVGSRDTVPAILDGSFDWKEVAPILGGENTTIGCVVTNARVDKVGCRILAEAAHDGLARSVMPAHAPADGDAFVCVSNNEVECDLADARVLVAAAVEGAVCSLSPNKPT